MTFGTAVIVFICALVMVYLIYALLCPEKF
jgi:K+-transporting ATPase KdpF subunit